MLIKTIGYGGLGGANHLLAMLKEMNADRNVGSKSERKLPASAMEIAKPLQISIQSKNTFTPLR